MAGIASVSLTPLKTASCSDVIGGGIVTDTRASYVADAVVEPALCFNMFEHFNENATPPELDIHKGHNQLRPEPHERWIKMRNLCRRCFAWKRPRRMVENFVHDVS